MQWAVIGREIAKNPLMGIPAVAERRAARGRTMQMDLPGPELLDRYAYEPLALIETHLHSVQRLDIAELGPGDFVGLAPLLLGAGASSYTAIDRFAGPIGSPEAKRFYEALMESCARRRPELATGLRHRGIEVARFPECYPELIRRLNCAIEALGDEAPERFNLVFSNNVLEHVSDLDKMASNVHQSLRPGGLSLHRVDFGPHDFWADQPDPLDWLRVSEPVWRWMGSNRATPNRKRLPHLVSAFEAVGFAVQAEILERFPDAAIEKLRQERPDFADMPPESLATRTAVVLARKH